MKYNFKRLIVTKNNPKRMLGGTVMISAEELRNIPQKNQSKRLSFFQRIQLRKIERKIKKEHKKGKVHINMGIVLWGDSESILVTLEEKGYDVCYFYTRYTGHRLTICWKENK